MGTIEHIYIALNHSDPMVERQEIIAIKDKGLVDDRHFQHDDKYSERQLSFIEAEAIEAVSRDYGIDFSPHESRRNITTRGIALNHLVGKEFFVGEVKMIGVELAEPCGHLQKLTEKKGIIKALIHRGGLRGRVLSDGVIRVGDNVKPV